MRAIWPLAALGLAWLATAAPAQPPATTPATPPTPDGNWRTPSATIRADVPRAARDPAQIDPDAPAATRGGAISPIEPLREIASLPRRTRAKVTSGPAALPTDQGQVWREYDITPYTSRVTTTSRPEQAIVDWILRETGYEAWHSEPVGVLSANSRSLKVYHTPQMHAVVADVVDRFVQSEAESHAFNLRVITVSSPNWRARSHGVLRPVPVQTQGIQAWLVHKEDAALMLAELRKRIDYREQSSPQLLVNNGQSATVSTLQTRSYTRDVVPRPNTFPGYEPDLAQFDEGFALEMSPLLSLDGRTIDAVIKCNIDQLEKLVSVSIDMPTPQSPRQRAELEVPQVTHCRLHERFRWPTDQVLVVGLGMVASPVPAAPNNLLRSLPLVGGPPRADLLVMIESKGKLPVTAATPATGQRDPRVSRNRY